MGPVERDGHQQCNIAVRNDRFEYIDFMLEHGGDINAGFENGNDLLRMVVRCAVVDAVTRKRIKFLAERGVEVRESGALREVVKGPYGSLAKTLLEHGADANWVPEPGATTCLKIAASGGGGGGGGTNFSQT